MTLIYFYVSERILAESLDLAISATFEWLFDYLKLFVNCVSVNVYVCVCEYYSLSSISDAVIPINFDIFNNYILWIYGFIPNK